MFSADLPQLTEYVRGKALSDGFASAMDVEGAIDAGWIKVEEPDKDAHDLAEAYSRDPGIHPGEAAVLAIGRRFDLLLLDDLCARAVCKSTRVWHGGHDRNTPAGV